jgi:hypothetical protein
MFEFFKTQKKPTLAEMLAKHPNPVIHEPKPPVVISMGPKHTVTFVDTEVVRPYAVGPTIEIKKYNKELSESLERGSNADFHYDFAHYGLIPVLPKDKIWLYSVSRMAHQTVHHPILKQVKFPAVEEGQEYAVVTSIPRIMRWLKQNVDSGQMEPVFEDGRRIAMDLINPDNLGLNQDELLGCGRFNGRSLGDMGIFWSPKNPPGKMEVKKAIKRMKKRYRFLLEQADAVQKSNPKMLRDTITPEHHAAANYMGGTYIWHGERLAELKVLAREVDAVRFL